MKGFLLRASTIVTELKGDVRTVDIHGKITLTFGIKSSADFAAVCVLLGGNPFVNVRFASTNDIMRKFGWLNNLSK